MSDEPNSPCVVARDPRCGHIRMAYVDDPTAPEHILRDRGRSVAAAVRAGQTIERIGSAQVRREMGACETCEPGITAKRAKWEAKKSAQQGGLGL